MERKYRLLAIHSQSDRPDAPLHFEGEPSEQAYESRALALPGDAVGLSRPIEVAYAFYYQGVLGQRMPEIIIPKSNGGSLSDAIRHDTAAREQIRAFDNRSEKRTVLSVFDPTAKEIDLAKQLQEEGIPIVPEVNYRVATELGNKAGFRKFCAENGLPQLAGGVFTGVKDIQAFVQTMQAEGKKVIVKHPFGTAGEGLLVVESIDQLPHDTFDHWIQGAGSVVAEEFSTRGTEHAVHVYVDPLQKDAKIVGLYEQLVAKKDDGGFAHYGCRYPIPDSDTRQRLSDIAHDTVIPALAKVNYTGPACFDVLANPDHFMELNARTGANMYAHRMVERVAREVYGIENTQDVAFMFLAGLPHDARSFAEFISRNEAALAPHDEGMLLLTNPGRHAFGSYDVIALSPYGLPNAEGVLEKGLGKMWGKEAAQRFFDRIYTR